MTFPLINNEAAGREAVAHIVAIATLCREDDGEGPARFIDDLTDQEVATALFTACACLAMWIDPEGLQELAIFGHTEPWPADED